MARQSEIMNEIAQIMLNATDEKFERLVLEVEVNVGEGWIGDTFRRFSGRELEYIPMNPKDSYKLMVLSFELHEEMINHTGGELEKFSIEIDETGTAHTKFAYGNEPPQPS